MTIHFAIQQDQKAAGFNPQKSPFVRPEPVEG